MNRRNLKVARRAVAITLAALAALAAALAIGGPFTLVVTAECLAALALVVVLARTPAGVRERGAPQAAAWARAAWARLRWRRRPPAEVRSGDFPAYGKISSDLGWAPVSQWHYDHGIRPLFGRLLESVLAERHRVDLARDPARARDLVGEDVWPLIDPSRPPSYDSKTPGADLRTLTRIVDRLEQL
jgi:hypothetical protein